MFFFLTNAPSPFRGEAINLSLVDYLDKVKDFGAYEVLASVFDKVSVFVLVESDKFSKISFGANWRLSSKRRASGCFDHGVDG
jgi:hypothetical protein